jgi:hypothetical protein
MRPAGYLYKFVAARPDWLRAGKVVDICSVSGCISRPFADYISHWKHNGYWLFDSPAAMAEIASLERIDLRQATLFYFEVYEDEFDGDARSWRGFAPEPSFVTDVQLPGNKRLLGYDIATFWAGAAPECSPLSCNSLADGHPVNIHCLLDSFDDAKQALESGVFDNAEPGPYRVFALYAIDPA